MRNLIILVVLFFAMNAFSFEKCMHTFDQTEIEMSRVQASEKISFFDCPESILLNGEYVRNLTLVREIDGKRLCTYGTQGINLTCIRD